MADTLTLQIDPETAEQLRRIAEKSGESIEVIAEHLLEQAAAERDAPDQYELSKEQLADLKERLKNPGPYASPERVAKILAKFKPGD